jgi:hypothetical protein
MKKISLLIFGVAIPALLISAIVQASSLGYLTPGTAGAVPYVAGGSIPVYANLDAFEDALSRGSINGAVICNAIDGTAVEIFDETRTRPDPSRYPGMGDFMKVRILDGDCSGKEGWVSISNLSRRPLS